MRFRKITVALVACLALAAVAATGAQAQWTIGTSGTAPLGATGHETVSVNKKASTTLSLSATVLGASVVLTAENVHCATGKICTIDGTNSGTNHSTGTLEFVNVTVDSPANCEVPGGKITTNALTDEVIMDPHNAAGPVFDKFFPQTGTTFVEIELSGAKCALDEVVVPVTGNVTGEAVDSSGSPVTTGTLQSPQILNFGSAEQTTGGGALKLGTAEAVLTGTIENTLSGAHVGEPFGADE